MNRAEVLIAACLAVALAGCPEKKTEDAGAAAPAPAPTQPPAAVDAGAVAAAPAAPAAFDAGAGGSAGTAARDGGQAKGATGAAPAPAALAEAEQIFATRCTVCHGPLGKGDGPGSQGLDPKPRNFTDPKWQSEVTDEYIEKIILNGGLAVGRSAAMPPNTDLASKPEVIAGLRAHVRSLRGK